MENNGIINQTSPDINEETPEIIGSFHSGSQPGLRILKGRHLYYELYREKKDKPDFKHNPGEIAICQGFDPDISESMQSHLNGECNDLMRPQKPEFTFFPSFDAPRLQFAMARNTIDGVTTTDTAFPAFTIQIKTDEETARALATAVMNHSAISNQQADLVAGEVRNGIHKLVSSITGCNLFADSFTILYSLRLTNGESGCFSAPVHLKPNGVEWRVAFTSAVTIPDGIAIQCVLYRAAVKIAVRMPLASYNQDWKLSNDSSEIWGIDIYGSPAAENNPHNYKIRGGRVSLSAESCSDILAQGELTEGNRPAMIIYSGVILEPENSIDIRSRVKDPVSYRRIGSLRLQDLPQNEEWVPLALSAFALYDAKAECRIPDYESSRPGSGYRMTNAAGCQLIAKVAFGCRECIPPVYLASGSSSSPSESLLKPDIYLGLRKGRGMIYLHQQSSEEWNYIPDGFESLFHPSEEVAEIVEKIPAAAVNDSESASSKYRIYKLEKLTGGGMRWLRDMDNPTPEWIEEEFEENHTAVPLEEYAESQPELILCSSPDIKGWYPEKSRITLPESGEIIYIGWNMGSGSGNYTLLAFTDQGIWKLAKTEFTHYSVPLQSWKPDNLISSLTAYGPESVINLRGGVVFAGRAGVMYLTGNSIRRLSRRGDSFPEDSILAYHQAADLLDIRIRDEDKERIIWVYDIEEEKEIISEKGNPEDILNGALDKHEDITDCDYKAITRPFRIIDSTQHNRIPLSFRICSRNGIGNYGNIRGKLIVQNSNDLQNWSTLTIDGMEAAYPCGETSIAAGSQWWRIGIFATKEWGIPTGLEITIEK